MKNCNNCGNQRFLKDPCFAGHTRIDNLVIDECHGWIEEKPKEKCWWCSNKIVIFRWTNAVDKEFLNEINFCPKCGKKLNA
jgi:hypothetical protein